MRPRRPLLLALAALCLVIAGCSEQESKKSDGGSSSLGTSTAGTETATTEAPTAPPETSGALKTKPKIPKPTGSPPKQLVKEDLIKGKGSVAKAGDQLQMNYVGVSFKTGKEFDSSFKTGQPFEFQLGAGMVIPGWDQGIAGMRVGGRRKLIIPSALAYGPAGSPPAIGPDETLVFVVDLLGKE